VSAGQAVIIETREVVKSFGQTPALRRAAATYSAAEMQSSLAGPGAAYHVMTAAGIVLALGLILATFPLAAGGHRCGVRRVLSPGQGHVHRGPPDVGDDALGQPAARFADQRRAVHRPIIS